MKIPIQKRSTCYLRVTLTDKPQPQSRRASLRRATLSKVTSSGSPCLRTDRHRRIKGKPSHSPSHFKSALELGPSCSQRQLKASTEISADPATLCLIPSCSTSKDSPISIVLQSQNWDWNSPSKALGEAKTATQKLRAEVSSRGYRTQELAWMLLVELCRSKSPGGGEEEERETPLRVYCTAQIALLENLALRKPPAFQL